MKELLALLATILGDDHALIATLRSAEPGDVDGDFSDVERDGLAAFANVDADTILEIRQALADGVDDIPAADLATAMDLAAGLDYIEAVYAEVAQAEADARQAAKDALAPKAVESDEDETADEDEDAETVEAEPVAETDDAETVEETEAEQVAEPVAAAYRKPTISGVRARVPRPAVPAPTVEAQEDAINKASFTLTASAAGHKEGDAVGWDELGEVFADRFTRLGNVRSGYSEDVVVASLPVEYPDEQRLGTDPGENGARIKAAAEQVRLAGGANPVLTAGVCAPATPIYQIAGIGTEARPVLSFLPSFQADRGGVTFRPGKPLSTIGAVDTTNSGISVWTSTNDTTPGSDGPSTKPVLTFTCPDPETVTVQSIAARMQATNMAGSYDPEAVGDLLRLQMIAYARIAENELLDYIDAGSTAIGPDTTLIIGFARQFLQSLNTAAAGIRSRERMDWNAPLDLLAPAWIINAMQDDLSFEQPGATAERLATTQAQIEDWLAQRNIRVGWFLDGDFQFGTQSAGANITDYPQSVELYLFEPGHHLHLAGARLDLGIVRDSTLNNTNAYQTFSEMDEAVASVGVVSYAIQVNVCRTGTSGAAAEITCGEVS